MANPILLCLNQAEDYVLNGRLSEAGNQLRKIALNKIPREEFARAAQLFRRVGAFDSALQLLMPIVRPNEKNVEPATPEEIVECAVCLQRVGAVDEACALLDSVPADQAPESLLYRTIFRFGEWDYRGGVHHLLRLINLSARDSYLNRLAQFHLASAFVVEGKFQEAETLLSELREATSLKGEYLMFYNCLELSTQVAVLTKNFARAEECLKEAEVVLNGKKTVDGFWILKWRSIMNAYFKKDIALLEPARKEALVKRQWEVLRELDFASCKIQRDENILNKLYFGSSFPGYRRILAKEFGEPAAAHTYIQKDGRYVTSAANAISIFTEKGMPVGFNKSAYNLLVMLLSDTYRGVRAGQLHSKLFGGEMFHPVTSTEQVQKLVAEARPVLEKLMPGVQIAHEDGSYKLDFSRFQGSLEVPKNLPRLRVNNTSDLVAKSARK